MTIPGSVTSVGSSSFNECSSLESITYKGTEEKWSTVTKGSNWDKDAGCDTAKGTYMLVFSPPAFTYGDATGDGIVDGKDLVRIKKYIAGYDFDMGISDVDIETGADANGDGVIDGKDLVRLKKYIAGFDFDTGKSDVELGPVA